MFFTKFYSKPNMPSVPFQDEQRKAGWAEPELQVTRPDGSQKTGLFPSAGSQLVVGSSPKANLVLEDAEVSERHLRFYIDETGRPVAEDLGSANGTWVNNERIRQATPLKHLDEVRVGGIKIRYICYRDQLGRALKNNDVVAAEPASEKIAGNGAGNGGGSAAAQTAPPAGAVSGKPSPEPKAAATAQKAKGGDNAKPVEKAKNNEKARPADPPAAQPSAAPKSRSSIFGSWMAWLAILMILLVIGYFALTVFGRGPWAA